MSEPRNSTKQRRARRSEAEWRALSARFEASGQNRAAFCAEQGVVLSSFGRWWRKLRSPSRRQAAVVADPVFVELAPEGDPQWEVELKLGAGVVLRLNRRTSGKTLRWAAYAGLLNRHPLLRPCIVHSWLAPEIRT